MPVRPAKVLAIVAVMGVSGVSGVSVAAAPAPVTPSASALSTSAPDKIVRRIEIAPSARLRPAVAKRVRTAPVQTRMTTVLRCEDGLCVHVSTKTAVSGTTPHEPAPLRTRATVISQPTIIHPSIARD